MSHPMQEVTLDEHGTARFRENRIVKFLLDWGPFDMNELGNLFGNREEFREDEEQLAQLIGYSVSGFGDLPYASEDVINEADAQVEEMLNDQ